jgi:large subunit ribosomal protein L24
MRLKKGDNVKVMAGKDRGKSGKITQVFPDRDRLVVDGVNAMSKHLKTRQPGAKGQKIDFNGPVRASNVQLVCPKCANVTRIGMKTVGEKKVRVCRKCEETIE